MSTNGIINPRTNMGSIKRRLTDVAKMLNAIKPKKNKPHTITSPLVYNGILRHFRMHRKLKKKKLVIIKTLSSKEPILITGMMALCRSGALHTNLSMYRLNHSFASCGVSMSELL